jgi:hypothetical protein
LANPSRPDGHGEVTYTIGRAQSSFSVT